MRQANINRHTMPDLSALFEMSILNVLLDSSFGADRGPGKYPQRGLWINFVRLTDKSLVEYGLARASLDEWIKGRKHGRFSALFRSMDHFETAIVSTHRASLMAAALKKEGYGLASLAPTARQGDMLRRLRNQIEHADEKIVGLKIARGEPFLLVPLESRLVLGGRTLSYRDLAACIQKMYRNVEHIRGASNA